MNGKADCQILLNEVLPISKQMLLKLGEFQPFGAVMKTGGEVVHVGLQTDNQLERGRERFERLSKSFEASAAQNEIRASAIVANFLLKNEGQNQDTIRISLEHARGYSVDVCYPYELIDGTVRISEPKAFRATRRVFR